MIIANPLYDVVFKYLLEDTEIAQEFLSTILGEPIVHLEVKPQETVTEISVDGEVRIIRFDFKATIETPTGELKKTLIELQKLKQSFNVMRFRRYLGDNYGKEDDLILGDGTVIKVPFPIVTIYILGFALDKLKNAVLKINREYQDVLTGTIIKVIKEDFIELLTHDSYIIQARYLPPDTKTKLERILQIFNPRFITKDKHRLDFTGDTVEPVVKKMVNRLQRAIVDDEMRKKMDVEDEIERILAREAKKVADEKDAIIVEKELEIAEQKYALAEKDTALAEKDTALAEKDTALAEKEREIAQKNEALAEKEVQFVRNLITNTDFSDVQIAAMANVSENFVKKSRL